MILKGSPFVYGRMVVGQGFTDRVRETERLVSNFRNGINTVLISPRRLGKTSLVRKAGELVNSEEIRVIYIDAFALRDASEFYTKLATEVIRHTSGALETWIENIAKFLSRITPKLSMGADPVNTLEIAFELESIEKNYTDILNLPEKIATDKKLKLVICIDEFQQTEHFSDSLLFHQRLRSAWQMHQSVTYCLYGSKKHMMTTLFEKQSRPFYKFGDTVYLGKISLSDWIAYILSQFSSTEKLISKEQAGLITQTVKCHSYYVQQFAHLVWSRTFDKVTDEIISTSLTELLDQNAMLYERITEALSDTQFYFLKLIASGAVGNFSSIETLRKHKIGTSANVTKLKRTLIEKEIIDLSGTSVEFLDPVFELWFVREILKRQ